MLCVSVIPKVSISLVLKTILQKTKILEERIAQKDWHKKGKVFLKMAGYLGD